jgi:hypothetical protein
MCVFSAADPTPSHLLKLLDNMSTRGFTTRSPLSSPWALSSRHNVQTSAYGLVSCHVSELSGFYCGRINLLETKRFLNTI